VLRTLTIFLPPFWLTADFQMLTAIPLGARCLLLGASPLADDRRPTADDRVENLDYLPAPLWLAADRRPTANNATVADNHLEVLSTLSPPPPKANLVNSHLRVSGSGLGAWCLVLLADR
jgi:hypothetical protein